MQLKRSFEKTFYSDFQEIPLNIFMSFQNKLDCLNASTAMQIGDKITNWTKVFNFWVPFNLIILNTLRTIFRPAEEHILELHRNANSWAPTESKTLEAATVICYKKLLK